MADSLEDLQKDVEAKAQASVDAQAAHSEADAKFRAARTATFDEKVVAQARDLGVNPDNFGTSEELAAALKTVKPEASTAKAGAISEADAAPAK